MSDHLQYFIIDKTSYVGSVENIIQRNTAKFWMSETPQKIIQIKAKFKQACFVQKIQIRGESSDIVEIHLKDFDDDIVQKVVFRFQEGKNSQYSTKNVETKSRIESIDILLYSSGEPKIMGLNFLLFKGSKDPMKNAATNQINNLSKQHTFKLQNQQKKPEKQTSEPYKNLYSRTIREKQMFNTRQKVPIQQQIKSKQQDQLQRAMRQSKQTYQKQIDTRKVSQTNEQVQFNSGETQPLQKQEWRYYTTSDIKDLLTGMTYVNQRWLAAQRKAEQQAGVREEERLSNYIQVRHLNNKKILIEGIIGQKRSKVQMIAESLGAKIIRNPEDYCLIISNNLDNVNVQKAIKSHKGIKALNENYLEDCKKIGTELPFDDYMLKRS